MLIISAQFTFGDIIFPKWGGGGGNYISVCASNALKPYPIHNLEPSIKRAAGINGILTQLISKQLQFIHPKAAGI